MQATGQTSAQQNGATSNAGHERAATPPPENPTTSNNSGGVIDLCSPDTDTHNIAPTRRKTRSQSTTDLTHTEKAAGSKGRSRSSTPAPAGAAAAGGGGGAAAGAVVSDPEIALKRLGASRVANIFTHLRKIALHPLLVRQRYDDAQVRIHTYIHTHTRTYAFMRLLHSECAGQLHAPTRLIKHTAGIHMACGLDRFAVWKVHVLMLLYPCSQSFSFSSINCSQSFVHSQVLAMASIAHCVLCPVRCMPYRCWLWLRSPCHVSCSGVSVHWTECWRR